MSILDPSKPYSTMSQLPSLSVFFRTCEIAYMTIFFSLFVSMFFNRIDRFDRMWHRGQDRIDEDIDVDRQVATSFLKAHLERTLRLSVLSLEQFWNG